ncbi:MAG: putative sulfate/molybdate transporter [Methanoregulaceae archaeon]
MSGGLFADANEHPDLVAEAASAVGNFGTVLPLLFGVVLATGLSPGSALLLFGLWYVIAGQVYRQPIPVEPMKAVAVVAIAGGVGAGQVAAAGLILGVAFLALGLLGWISPIVSRIPVPVTRGVQLALGFMLARSALGFAIADPVLTLLGLLIILAFWLIRRQYAVPDLSALVVLAIGVGLGVLGGASPSLTLPVPVPVFPTTGDWVPALLLLVVPQALLTLTNSIAATELLARDLLPRPPRADLLSRMIGLMNLGSVPFGGIPLCHGAGGLAAQYRFGARTGWSNLFAGLLLIGIAFVAGTPESVALFPPGLLAALLLAVALTLARHGVQTTAPVPTAAVAIASLVTSLTVAFVVGWIVAWASSRFLGGHLRGL